MRRDRELIERMHGERELLEPSLGEKDVVAAIVATDRDRLDVAGVFAACRKGLASNFVPSYPQVVDGIPKTASEKPQERFPLEALAPDTEGVLTEEPERTP